MLHFFLNDNLLPFCVVVCTYFAPTNCTWSNKLASIFTAAAVHLKLDKAVENIASVYSISSGAFVIETFCLFVMKCSILNWCCLREERNPRWSDTESCGVKVLQWKCHELENSCSSQIRLDSTCVNKPNQDVKKRFM